MVGLRRAQYQGKWQWNTSIESPHTGERHTFASLQELFAYLSNLCSSQVPHMPDTCPEG